MSIAQFKLQVISLSKCDDYILKNISFRELCTVLAFPLAHFWQQYDQQTILTATPMSFIWSKLFSIFGMSMRKVSDKSQTEIGGAAFVHTKIHSTPSYVLW